MQWLTTWADAAIAAKAESICFRLSPDGRRLAISTIEGSDQDIWVYEPQRDTMTRLTFGAGAASSYPLWTPDGRYVLFEATGGMYWTRADGAGKAQPLTRSNSTRTPTAQTPDP
jgi:Tol biopolymer transport system component